jgi:predicted metal-dependent enzyme (double-stranded beta helix superfamily)
MKVSLRMCDTGYSVKQLVQDLAELGSRGVSEPELLGEARDLVKRLLLMKHNWLRAYMCKPTEDPSSAGVYKLHEEPDHSLAVFVVTWAPGRETPPHDHGTWAIIAGLDGWETNHRWKRLDDGGRAGYAEVVRDRSERIDAGAISALPADTIHSVHNDSGALSVTLHVYGMHPDHTDRQRFDPEARTASDYRFGATLG